MNSRRVSSDWADSILKTLIGQYVWGLRCVADRILQIEFGEPYLSVQQLQGSSEPPSEAVEFVSNRRLVMPKGQWSLFIEDGLWSMDVVKFSCNRSESCSDHLGRCLDGLSGQKVVSATAKKSNNNLEICFDLSGRLSISKNVDFKENDQWILFSKDMWNLACCWNGDLNYESQS